MTERVEYLVQLPLGDGVAYNAYLGNSLDDAQAVFDRESQSGRKAVLIERRISSRALARSTGKLTSVDRAALDAVNAVFGR